METPPQTRKKSFLGRTQKHKKAVGVRAGRGKCGAIKSTFSIVTQGDTWWMRSQLWWLKGADQALLGFILSSLAVCKETFASCHKRLRPRFYGVQTRGGMSIHSSCLAGAATGTGLISPLSPSSPWTVCSLVSKSEAQSLEISSHLWTTSANILPVGFSKALWSLCRAFLWSPRKSLTRAPPSKL